MEDHCTTFVAETNLPTVRGFFRVRAYKEKSGKEPIAIIEGNVEGTRSVPIRVHDACFTSEVLGSMKCDCAEQLSLALDYIKKEGRGLVIYLQQEGRGIGISNKIAAYALQEEGFDTVQANEKLGFPDDSREYYVVKEILDDLQIQSVRLITNNPRKIEKLESLGIVIDGRIPSDVKPNQYNVQYLKTKEEKMNHMLSIPTPVSTHKNTYQEDSIHFYEPEDPYGWLSNFSEHGVHIDNLWYPTTEHYYQSKKYEGTKHEVSVRLAPTPAIAFQMGREYDIRPLRQDWDNVKEAVMKKAIYAKFTQHKDLRDQLLATGHRHLAEHTKKDKFWGDGGDGSGLNRLGFLLMELREDLREHS